MSLSRRDSKTDVEHELPGLTAIDCIIYGQLGRGLCAVLAPGAGAKGRVGQAAGCG